MNEPSDGLTRRAFLKGKVDGGDGAPAGHCVSSAVVTLLPGREQEVLARLGAMEGVEIGARQGAKLVVLLEGPGSGAVGALLVQIAVMDGVVSANMVFEHVEAASI